MALSFFFTPSEIFINHYKGALANIKLQ